MKALTLTPPLDWLCSRGIKTIENRSWPTKEQGWFLIHAASTMSQEDYDLCEQFARGEGYEGPLPKPHEVRRGCIVGAARLVGCLHNNERARIGRPTRWAMQGQFGFDLADALPLPPVPAKGALSFWKVPKSVRETLLAEAQRQSLVLPPKLAEMLGAETDEPPNPQQSLF